LEAIKCLSNTNKYGNIKRLLFIFWRKKQEHYVIFLN
jgi:hypothetical protein